MFVRNGAVTPGPSCECDITFVEGRPKSARLRGSTVAARRAQSVTVPSSRETRMSFRRVKVPPLEKRPISGGFREGRGFFSAIFGIDFARFSAGI